MKNFNLLHAPNNLDLIRLFAAWLVLIGHSFIFLGIQEPMFLSITPMGPIGVYIFFTISGYLVFQSWDRDPSFIRFFSKRILRLIPGLLVCTLLSVFVLGPLVTTIKLKTYFFNPATRGYFENILLYSTYYLPGVFEKNRVPNAVNGSLWSLPVEFFMYILTSIFGFMNFNKIAILIVAIIFAIITYFWSWRSTEMLVYYGTDIRQIFICGTFFWVGAVFYKFSLKNIASIQLVTLAFVVMIFSQSFPNVLNIAMWICIPAIVIWFGFSHSSKLDFLTRHGDYSYGFYIYAFPIQQTVAEFYPGMPIYLYIAICSFVTFFLPQLHGMELKNMPYLSNHR